MTDPQESAAHLLALVADPQQLSAHLLALELIEVRKTIAAAKIQEAELIQALAEAMPGKTYELPGVAAFERHKAVKRAKWDHESLQSTLVRKIRAGEIPKQVDPLTGEVLDEDDIAKTARVFTSTANPSWRIGALKELDIQPDEYNETTYDGTYTLKISGVQS